MGKFTFTVSKAPITDINGASVEYTSITGRTSSVYDLLSQGKTVSADFGGFESLPYVDPVSIPFLWVRVGLSFDVITSVCSSSSFKPTFLFGTSFNESVLVFVFNKPLSFRDFIIKKVLSGIIRRIETSYGVAVIREQIPWNDGLWVGTNCKRRYYGQVLYLSDNKAGGYMFANNPDIGGVLLRMSKFSNNTDNRLDGNFMNEAYRKGLMPALTLGVDEICDRLNSCGVVSWVQEYSCNFASLDFETNMDTEKFLMSVAKHDSELIPTITMTKDTKNGFSNKFVWMFNEPVEGTEKISAVYKSLFNLVKSVDEYSNVMPYRLDFNWFEGDKDAKYSLTGNVCTYERASGYIESTVDLSVYAGNGFNAKLPEEFGNYSLITHRGDVILVSLSTGEKMYEHIDANGFPYYKLKVKPNKTELVKTERIVARTLFGESIDCYTVEHKDGDKSNNIPDNLLMKKTLDSDIVKLQSKVRTNKSLCKPVGVYRNNHLLFMIDSLSDGYHKYGFTPSEVSKCCNGKRDVYKGYTFKFL